MMINGMRTIVGALFAIPFAVLFLCAVVGHIFGVLPVHRQPSWIIVGILAVSLFLFIFSYRIVHKYYNSIGMDTSFRLNTRALVGGVGIIGCLAIASFMGLAGSMIMHFLIGIGIASQSKSHPKSQLFIFGIGYAFAGPIVSYASYNLLSADFANLIQIGLLGLLLLGLGVAEHNLLVRKTNIRAQ